MKSFRFFPALFTLLCLFSICSVSFAAQDSWLVGEVDTAFKLIGPNHKIKVEAFRDPDFPCIVCYVSYAQAGGLSGAVGLAENPARFSLSVVRTDRTHIEPTKKQKKEKEVFTSRSAFFRTINVHRFYDSETNAFVYVAVSRILSDGSPFNAVTVIPLD